MFVSEKIIFTELHKTGGTHICSWLKRLVGGEQVGKHNRIPPDLQDRFVIGSIRNPWEWYVSLWAYGCGGKGSVFRQTTRRVDLRYLNRQLHGEMGLRRIPLKYWIQQFWRDFRKPVKDWRAAYSDSSDPENFRKWLRMIMDYERRFDIGEGFGFSPVSRHSGLMTYRCLKLFTCLAEALYDNPLLSRTEVIRSALEKNLFVRFVIRNEHLEEDLLRALALAGCSLDEKEKTDFIGAKRNKTNVSERLPASFYYDRRTLDLIAEKERILIDRFDYEPPVPEYPVARSN